MEEKARGEVLSIANQRPALKILELKWFMLRKKPVVTSLQNQFRLVRADPYELVGIPKHLKNCKNNTECDALLINGDSQTDTYPAISVQGDGNSIQHEAAVSKVSAEQIFIQQRTYGTEAMSLPPVVLLTT